MTLAATDLGCSVYVNGGRLADSAEQYLASAPTVLAGLVTAWGRNNVIDQPEASTCSFEVRDKDGDTDFLALLHVGKTVDVYSSAPTGTGQPVDVAEDGSFEVTAVSARVTVKGAASAVAVSDPASGNTAVRVTASSTASATVNIPPGPWASDPGAWDGIPQVTQGESWNVSLATVRGVAVRPATVALALFGTPLRSDPIAVLASVAAQDAGATSVTAVIPAGYPVAWAGAVLTMTGALPWSGAIGAWSAAVGSWQDQWARWDIDNLKVIAPAQARKRVSVFSGRITDLEATGVNKGVRVKVTATDLTADLANDTIGDTPWSVQTIAQRVTRIRALATAKFTVDVDAGIQPIRVTYRDVDAQAVMGLLSELAVSGDSVLWSAFQSTRGFYLWYEDPGTRTSLATLTWDAGKALVVLSGNIRPTQGVTISACDIRADTVAYRSDVTDVVTRVDLTWQEQTVDDKGLPAPTERHVTVSDGAAEAEYGIRRVSYSTQLITEADGREIANRVLARSRSLGWRADNATWDMSLTDFATADDLDTALTMLDGTRRIGLPLTLTDLPSWAPDAPSANLYVEGGTYTYQDATWQLALTVSPAGTTGYSALWLDLDPAWHWNQFDPSISWRDLWGASAQYASPRWAQVTNAWHDDTHTWAQYYGPQT